jgi:hypothetical protein
LEGRHGTITRIEQLPDPDFLGIETQEDWDEFLRIRWVQFWAKLDDFPELDDYYKHHEVVLRYRELQPLSPRMTEQQLAQYCKEHFLKEQNTYRRDAFLRVMRYLNGEWPGYPLSSFDLLVPKGYYVDLINRFISWTTRMQQTVQETREKNTMSKLTEIYEAQVYKEVYQRLMPKQRDIASLRNHSGNPIPARS